MRRPSETILQEIVNSNDPATETKLGDALRYAVNRCDVALLQWLADIEGPSVSIGSNWNTSLSHVYQTFQASILDKFARDFRDHHGYPIVSSCIIASTATTSAKEEKEQAVRILVKRWPGIGLRGADNADEHEEQGVERFEQGKPHSRCI